MFKRQRVACRFGKLPSFALVFACCAALLAEAMPTAGDASPNSNQLRRVNGTVAFQTASSTEQHTIFGKQDLPADATAITKAASVGELALPDSSIVTIGADTTVNIGEFTRSTDGPGATIFIRNGTLRFDIKRPAGGRANYIFQTQTSQIAVRGTIGVISFIDGVTRVACVQCSLDSISVTVGPQTTPVLDGQMITIAPNSTIVPGVLTHDVAAQFGRSGVSTTAGTGGSSAAGITAAVAGAGAIAGTIIANNATAAPAATAAAALTPTPTPITPSPAPTTTATAAPTVTPSPTATASPTATPTRTPTPGPTATPTSSGNVNLTGGRRSQTHDNATPAATAPPPAARPAIAPPDIPRHPIR